MSEQALILALSQLNADLVEELREQKERADKAEARSQKYEEWEIKIKQFICGERRCSCCEFFTPILSDNILTMCYICWGQV
jgi:hypothetical protein